MKRLTLPLKLISFFILLSITTLQAQSLSGIKPLYDKVYRSDRIGDSYHFLMLTKSGKYIHLYTNRTDNITASELKSSNLISILKKKQSWGKSFPKKGNYTIDDKGRIYTKLLWDRVKILASTKIKYLNKTFYLK